MGASQVSGMCSCVARDKPSSFRPCDMKVVLRSADRVGETTVTVKADGADVMELKFKAYEEALRWVSGMRQAAPIEAGVATELPASPCLEVLPISELGGPESFGEPQVSLTEARRELARCPEFATPSSRSTRSGSTRGSGCSSLGESRSGDEGPAGLNIDVVEAGPPKQRRAAGDRWVTRRSSAPVAVRPLGSSPPTGSPAKPSTLSRMQELQASGASRPTLPSFGRAASSSPPGSRARSPAQSSSCVQTPDPKPLRPQQGLRTGHPPPSRLQELLYSEARSTLPSVSRSARSLARCRESAASGEPPCGEVLLSPRSVATEAGAGSPSVSRDCRDWRQDLPRSETLPALAAFGSASSSSLGLWQDVQVFDGIVVLDDPSQGEVMLSPRSVATEVLDAEVDSNPFVVEQMMMRAAKPDLAAAFAGSQGRQERPFNLPRTKSLHKRERLRTPLP